MTAQDSASDQDNVTAESFVHPDGYCCRGEVWRVANPLRRVVMLHGIISHAGWYRRGCEALSRQGNEIHFLDRRGSGQNKTARGDVDRWQTWLDDLAGYLRSLPDDLPRVLMGISWGGKLAAAFARRSPELVDAMALICPGLYAQQFPSALGYGALRVSRCLGGGGVRLPIPLRDPSLFTDVADWQTFILRDEKTLRRITVRFALEDRKLTLYSRSGPERVNVPALMMLAGRDRIVDNVAMRRHFASMRCPDNRLIEYPRAAHTFEFEPDPTQYFSDLNEWLCQFSRT